MSTPQRKEPGQTAFEAFFGHPDKSNPYRERWALSPNREAWAAVEKAVRNSEFITVASRRKALGYKDLDA